MLESLLNDVIHVWVTSLIRDVSSVFLVSFQVLDERELFSAFATLPQTQVLRFVMLLTNVLRRERLTAQRTSITRLPIQNNRRQFRPINGLQHMKIYDIFIHIL